MIDYLTKCTFKRKKKNGRVMKIDLHEKILYYTCTWCCTGDRLFKRYNSVAYFQRVREPPSYHFENYSKENIPHRLLFSCLPLRLFPVAFVYYSPLWFPCNGGEILNNLFSLQGKKIVLLNEPREGSYADGFSFSVFSSKYWNVYYVVQEEEWDETIFRRPAQIALGK